LNKYFIDVQRETFFSNFSFGLFSIIETDDLKYDQLYTRSSISTYGITNNDLEKKNKLWNSTKDILKEYLIEMRTS